ASSAFLEAIPSVSREGSEIGTIWFGPKLPVFGSRGSATRSMSRFSLDETPVFVDIEDVDGVYRLVLDLKNQKAKSPAFSR
ncbi:MAG TPA: hypothetical protein VJV74_09560, partial [Terriglobia bacterium]|nr:hypothetical protein [Terriglobia bacterium]